MENTKHNIMLDGDITKTIITLSAPLMFNNLIRTLYNLTDGLYVAQLSSDDFAASAFVWPLNFLFISLGMGVGIGATTLISQRLGARQHEKANQYAQNALNISLLIGFILSIIGFFLSSNFVQWMGGTGEFAVKSTTYLKINFIGLFFDFGYFAYQAFLNSEGNTKTITMISIISSLINIILDPILIFKTIPLVNLPGFNMGISGAAWATVFSKFVLLLLAVYVVKHQSQIKVRVLSNDYQFSIIRDLAKIAIPSSLGYSGAAMGFTVLNGLIQSYGTDTLAAFSMGNRLSDLLTQPQMGIGMALTSLIGQNVGAKQYDRAKAIFKRTNLIIGLISLVSSILVYFFKQELLSLFITDMSNHNLWSQAIEYMMFSTFIIFFMGFFSSYNGVFQGMGKTSYSMLMSIGRLWILRLPLIWLFSHFSNLGSTGIWISMLLSNGLTVLFAALIYRKINWDSL